MKNIIKLIMTFFMTFSLVACGGKSTEPVKEPQKEEPTTNEKTDNSTNTSALDSDAKEILDSLQTDYNKINWGVEYNLSEDYPGLIVSVTPIEDDMLLVGLTNLYDNDISVAADVKALGNSDKEIGNTYIYENALGSGNTSVTVIYCDDVPDGRLRWSDVEIKASSAKYIPWEADYSAKKADDYQIQVDYEVYSANNEDMSGFEMRAVLLDSNGYVIGYGADYSSDDIKAGTKKKGTVSIYIDSDLMDYIADVALFSNPSVY